MAKGIYVANAEPFSEQSIVALGMMELLWSQTQKVGFFRPVVDDVQSDAILHLIASRYKTGGDREAQYGATHETAHKLIAANKYDELLKRIMEKYRALSEKYEVVLCAGTDFKGIATPLEFDFNIDMANNLGCLLMPVLRGYNRSLVEMSEALADISIGLEKRKCDILAIVFNRVATDLMIDTPVRLKNFAPAGVPVYALAEDTALWKPSICEIATAINGTFVSGKEACSQREVMDFKVAAMELPNFLGYLKEGTVVITPGDRSDILVGSLAADVASTYPTIAGIILTGGLKPAPNVQRLIDGFGKKGIPILSVDADTFTAAIKVNQVEGALIPENPRKVTTALGIFESGVKVHELKDRIAVTASKRITPLMFEYDIIQRAKADRQHIVLPEGEEDRILQAAELLTLRQVCELTVLGDPRKIKQKISELNLKLDKVNILHPATSELRKDYAETYYELRRLMGVTKEGAFDTMADSSYFGTMMVYKGLATGMVSGSVNTTQHTIRPSLEFIKTKPGVSIVSSVFFMCLADRVLVFGDCAVNPNPNEKQLAEIAISSAETAAAFGIEPRVALLSYSTGASEKGKDVEKVKEAVRLAREARPDLPIEGPLQFDAAIDPEVAKLKLPESTVAGKATVFIFPDLNTGNNTYKAVQRSSGAIAIGPVLQGLNKAVNDLSRDCTVADILNAVAITAIQAQASGKGK